MKLPSIPYLVDAFLGVFRRFPLVMAAATIGVVSAMILIERSTDVNDQEFEKIVMTCSLGLATLLCSAIICEKWRLRGAMAILPHLIAVALLVLYYFTLELGHDFDLVITPMRFIGLNLAAHLGVAFLPYLDKSPVEDFWEYNKQLFGNFMVGAFYSLVIFAGLSIAILAVDQLFNLAIEEKIYAHLFVLIAGIFNTTYFLAHFPADFDFSAETVENQEDVTLVTPYTTSFKNLTKFILIPIVAIYFLILYAFSAKILVTWQLPEGWVGKLVLGFSVAGIFTYLLNYLLVKFDDSLLVKGFRRWFFFVLLPMVALLFVAIGRRIGDYGVTEARYVVAISGVWLLLMSLYFIASKNDNIKFIPISLAFFSLLTVLGPFSAFQVSERNQVARLESVLIKNNILENGKVTAPKDSLSKADAEAIRSSVDYLQRSGYSKSLATLLDIPVDSVAKWDAVNKQMSLLGIEPTYSSENYCSVYFDNANKMEMDISNFQLMYKVYAYEKTDNGNFFSGFEITPAGNGLQYYKNGVALDSFDLKPYCRMLQEKDACNYNSQRDSLNVFEASSTAFDLKFYVENLSFNKDGNWKVRECSGTALLRKKQ